ncbi:MAG TPA: radical SAM protein [Elusimicrobiota bacterium]|nr:radical SAM protein [Elusimicrobiota bacterium]
MKKPNATVKEFIYPKLDRWKDSGLARWPVFTADDEVLRELHFELTYRCNLKCRICDLWGQERQDSTKVSLEMGADEIKRFVRGSKKLSRLEVLVLSGGEPLLKNDAVELVDFFTAHSPSASIGILSNLSNEELIRARLDEIFSRCAPRLWVGTSMDGIGPVHDKMRGAPGSWDRMVKTIAFLRERYPSVDVSITYTMTPHNYRELTAVHDWAEAHKCGFGAQYVVQKEGTEVFRWTRAQLGEVSRQVDALVDRLCRQADAVGHIYRDEADKLKWLWARLYYWRTLVDYGFEPKRYFPPCLAGRRYAMLDPWGNVSFCSPHKKKPVGNVRETPFDVLWENDKARRLREHIDAGRCDCWLMCTANPVIDRLLALALPSPVPVAP